MRSENGGSGTTIGPTFRAVLHAGGAAGKGRVVDRANAVEQHDPASVVPQTGTRAGPHGWGPLAVAGDPCQSPETARAQAKIPDSGRRGAYPLRRSRISSSCSDYDVVRSRDCAEAAEAVASRTPNPKRCGLD